VIGDLLLLIGYGLAGLALLSVIAIGPTYRNAEHAANHRAFMILACALALLLSGMGRLLGGGL
jgi:uncharacterized membrane protein YqjE